MPERPLRIALAGLGTVGAGVVRLLDENAALIERRAGRPLRIVAVTARDRAKDRGVDLGPFQWVDDMASLAERDDIDCVVELIGGADGPALTLARRALTQRKAFVTANKAMVAHHGLALAHAAEQSGAAFKYEAAVAGGIPVIKGLREGAAANEIRRVYGILNGTSNFILSAMESSGRDFANVLAEAQAKGYAEADPGFDINGTDAAHKLSILSAIAFGTRIDFDGIEVDGIAAIQPADIAQADALGYRIRLLGIAEIDRGNGEAALFQRVHPYLVPKSHPLAHVEGSTNAVVAEGNFSGRLLFQGAGAGDGPTASAVVADLIDIARGEVSPAFSMPVDQLEPLPRAQSGHRRGKNYLRFEVVDRPGVLAELTAAMRDAGVSIESLIQKDHNAAGAVLVAMVAHEGPESAVSATLTALRGSDSLRGEPLVIRILDEAAG